MLERIRQELISWLPIIATFIVVLLAIVLVIFLFTKLGGNTPVWLQAAVMVTIVVLLGILAISVLAPAPAAGVADPVPIRIGVVLLGVIVVACVAGLIQIVNSPPQVVEPTPPLEASQGGSQSQGDGTAGGGEATPAPATGSVANTANLGLSGQIVGIFGTIAAASVGGIAGLLTPRGG